MVQRTETRDKTDFTGYNGFQWEGAFCPPGGAWRLRMSKSPFKPHSYRNKSTSIHTIKHFIVLRADLLRYWYLTFECKSITALTCLITDWS